MVTQDMDQTMESMVECQWATDKVATDWATEEWEDMVGIPDMERVDIPDMETWDIPDMERWDIPDMEI